MSRPQIELRSCLAALAGVLVLGGCAQAATESPSPTASSHTETVIDAPGGGQPGTGSLRYHNDVQAHTATLDVPVDSAWARVRRAYATLRIPVTTVDPPHHLIGAERAIVHDRLAGDRMSRWLSCGFTSVGQPRADSYTVYLTVLTQVLPASSGSTVRSIVNAMAEPTDGSTNQVQCSSTGALEDRLQSAIGAEP